MPLLWAHSEYLKLVRSAVDGQVFDLIPEVVGRYQKPRTTAPLEVWKFNWQVRSLLSGAVLRSQLAAAFRLRWACNERKQTHDTDGGRRLG